MPQSAPTLRACVQIGPFQLSFWVPPFDETQNFFRFFFCQKAKPNSPTPKVLFQGFETLGFKGFTCVRLFQSGSPLSGLAHRRVMAAQNALHHCTRPHCRRLLRAGVRLWQSEAGQPPVSPPPAGQNRSGFEPRFEPRFFGPLAGQGKVPFYSDGSGRPALGTSQVARYHCPDPVPTRPRQGQSPYELRLAA
jgi:hypothetical protein